MSNAVQAVVREWESQERLGEDLCEDGKSSETRGHSGALEMPAEEGGDKVCGTVGVDGDRKKRAGNSVE